MGAVVFADEEESGFFGMPPLLLQSNGRYGLRFCTCPTSNIALLRYISQATTSASPVLFTSPTASTQVETDVHLHGGLLSFSRPSSPRPRSSRTSKGVNLYHLPSEPEALNLFKLYFSNTGYLFPYVHEESFMATYNEIKDQQKPTVRRTWLGLLNAIFAMAITTKLDSDSAAAQRSEESEVFYERAVGLCEYHILRGTSLEIGLFKVTQFNRYHAEGLKFSIF